MEARGKGETAGCRAHPAVHLAWLLGAEEPASLQARTETMMKLNDFVTITGRMGRSRKVTNIFTGECGMLVDSVVDDRAMGGLLAIVECAAGRKMVEAGHLARGRVTKRWCRDFAFNAVPAMIAQAVLGGTLGAPNCSRERYASRVKAAVSNAMVVAGADFGIGERRGFAIETVNADRAKLTESGADAVDRRARFMRAAVKAAL